MLKSRLLIINSTLERSGITNVMYNLCKYLDKSRFDVGVLTLSAERTVSRWTEFADIGVHLHTLSLGRFASYKAPPRNFVGRYNPDIIHTFSYRGTYFTGKFLRGYKHVATTEANLLDNYTDILGGIVGRLAASRELAAFARSDRKIVCSHALMKLYSRYQPHAVIPNGADEELFHPVSDDEKISLRKKFDLPVSATIFITVGGLIKRKDPVTVIRSFNASGASNAMLLVLGDGRLMDDCRALGGNVRFCGNVKNVDEYVKASDVFISASKSEGLPNTVVEAALCGLRCLLSDIPQHREIFDPGSAQAAFFPAGDTAVLASLISNHRSGGTYAPMSLTAGNMARQYSELYQQLISDGN